MMHRISRTALVSLIILIGLSAGTALAQAPGGDDAVCWTCHRQPGLTGIEGARVDIALCQACHGDPQVNQEAQTVTSPLYVDEARYATTIHGQIACIACHSEVARNPHRSDEQVDCAMCHAAILIHVDMGAPHLDTDCAACHLSTLPVIKNEETGQVVLAIVTEGGTPVDRTGHDIVTAPTCEKCHVAGNQVGAPSATLPARSVLCMACHDASPTISISLFHPAPVQTDYASLIGLFVFGVGMVFHVSLYLRGEIPGHPDLTAMQKLNHLGAEVVRFVFSRRIFRFVGGAIADGIFLRRSLQESVSRWVMHALLYWPFLIRFGLGLVTWLGELFWPSAAWTQTLANKNAHGIALTYDVTAVLVLLGVIFALVRRFVLRDRRLLSFEQDRIAISLLGTIFLLGIVTEGFRLLSAGTPQSVAVYSFLGYAVAALLRPLNLAWTSIYPFLWYLHGWLAVAFIAYLPFSKFMHILAGPFIASLDNARKGKH
jgi:nitrate reductase gamma subunit